MTKNLYDLAIDAGMNHQEFIDQMYGIYHGLL